MTVLATTAAGAPVVDAEVVFSTTSGPNAGMSASVQTDLDGQAMFAYVGSATGTDVIVASLGAVTSNTAELTWSPATTSVPTGSEPALAIRVLSNPAPGGQPRVSFSLPSAVPASLELFDLAVRQVVTQRVDDVGSGTQVLALDPAQALAPGVLSGAADPGRDACQSPSGCAAVICGGFATG